MNILRNPAIDNTVAIVSAFLSNNTTSASDVPSLISKVHEAVTALDVPKPSLIEKPEPAVSIRASVKPDYLICLECGKKHKTLRGHLNATHNMSEHEYRSKYNLPSDYPFVAPNYSEQRSQLAKSLGLGRKRKG